MYVCFAYMYVCAWSTHRGQMIWDTLRLELLVDGYELPCGYWKSNWGSLEDQLVSLTDEPYL